MRLDEEKLEALRAWGEGLRQTGGEEPAAIGRAILMLIEEIDQLHVDLWHARLAEPEPTPAAVAQPDEEQAVSSSLHRRVQRMLGRRTEAVAPQGGENVGDAGPAASSPQAWIDALRRQK
jgi:hypothetical protein